MRKPDRPTAEPGRIVMEVVGGEAREPAEAPGRAGAGRAPREAGATASPRCEEARRGEGGSDGGMPDGVPQVAADGPPAGGRPELQALEAMFAVAVFSEGGRLLRGNDRHAALFGASPEELLGRRRQELAVDAQGETEALWAALRLGGQRMQVYQARRPDGAELWVRGRLWPLVEGGRLREVVEVAIDISEQLRTQAEEHGQVAAIDVSQSVVHVAMDGTVLHANRLFLEAMGYEAGEVTGRPHAMFVAPGGEAEHAALWEALRAGQHRSGEWRRRGRDGREVWMQGSCTPILSPGGRVCKVVEYATDVTAEKLRRSDFQWQVAAIHKSYAVATFSMDGLILDANALFLEAMGYALDEVVGRHHRMFVDAAFAHGAEYAAFWRELGRGRHQSGLYCRLDRLGREVWLQATYNPIFDLGGRLVKVVKYATVVTEERRRQAEHQGQIAAIHKAQGVIAFALDGTILDANDNMLDALGYRLGEVRGRHHRILVDPEHARGEEYAAFWTSLALGQHQAGEFRRRRRDGSEIWLQATYNPIFDGTGRPFKVVEYATDVTEERLRRADMQGQLQAIRKSQGVISFAMDGTILDANSRFLEAVGYALDEIRGHHHAVLLDPAEARSAEYAQFWETLREGHFVSGLYRRVGKGGRTVWIQASYNPILDGDGRPFKVVKFATDVTSNVALSEAYEDAKRQAQHDPGTTLPNRVRLAAFMSRALAVPGGRVAALYLDLDRFKPINDTHGHQVGDRVLGEVADRLRRCLGPEQIAARVGGDEFVVAGQDLSPGEAEELAQRLIAAVSAPIRCEGTELAVGASVGIALSPEDAVTPDELLRHADEALYRAKRAGRGTYGFFAASLNERLQGYRNLVAEIGQGLERDQFVVEYQPRFDVETRRIRSVEALVRWNHPERGKLWPADFIPAAERSGLVVPLGEWVLRRACTDLAGWPHMGISVNVSPLQFRAGDLVGTVRAAMAAAGLEAGRLELEITEGMLLEDAERARRTLEELKRLGVRLAIDDFGTGYSSLSSLRSFPFDVIKIDRQFIADMEAREGGREVVRAILGLGEALGMAVTAEGVETARQLAMLADEGCAEVQGYFLAHPVPAAEITRMLREEHEGARQAVA